MEETTEAERLGRLGPSMMTKVVACGSAYFCCFLVLLLVAAPMATDILGSTGAEAGEEDSGQKDSGEEVPYTRLYLRPIRVHLDQVNATVASAFLARGIDRVLVGVVMGETLFFYQDQDPFLRGVACYVIREGDVVAGRWDSASREGDTVKVRNRHIFCDCLDMDNRSALFWNYPRKLEPKEPLEFGFVIENLLGHDHTYTYTVEENTTSGTRILFVGEEMVAAGGVENISVSIHNASRLGVSRIQVHLDTGEENYFWLAREAKVAHLGLSDLSFLDTDLGLGLQQAGQGPYQEIGRVLDSCDLVVLDNVPPEWVTEDSEVLLQAVIEGGLGLVMFGGPNSLEGNGTYSSWCDGPLGGLLPVECRGHYEEIPDAYRVLNVDLGQEAFQDLDTSTLDTLDHLNPCDIRPGSSILYLVEWRGREPEPLLVQWDIGKGNVLICAASLEEILVWEEGKDFVSRIIKAVLLSGY